MLGRHGRVRPSTVAVQWRLALYCAIFLFGGVNSEILTPPYFNLAEGRKIYASATCGEDTEGPELFCKLVGANAEHDANFNLIQGQVNIEWYMYAQMG